MQPWALFRRHLPLILLMVYQKKLPRAPGGVKKLTDAESERLLVLFQSCGLLILKKKEI